MLCSPFCSMTLLFIPTLPLRGGLSVESNAREGNSLAHLSQDFSLFLTEGDRRCLFGLALDSELQ